MIQTTKRKSRAWQFFATFALAAIERREARLEDPRKHERRKGDPLRLFCRTQALNHCCLRRLLTLLHDYSSITTTLYLEIRVRLFAGMILCVAFYEEHEIVAVPEALHDALSNVRLLYRIVINLCYTSMCKNR